MEGEDHCLDSRNVAQLQFKYIWDVFEMFPEKLKFFFSYNGNMKMFKILDQSTLLIERHVFLQHFQNVKVRLHLRFWTLRLSSWCMK